MNITCKHCGNEQDYHQNGDNPPIRPKARCKACEKWIYFKIGDHKKTTTKTTNRPHKITPKKTQKVDHKIDHILTTSDKKYIPQITDEMSAYRLLFGTTIRKSKLNIAKEIQKNLPDLILKLSNTDI